MMAFYNAKNRDVIYKGYCGKIFSFQAYTKAFVTQYDKEFEDIMYHH